MFNNKPENKDLTKVRVAEVTHSVFYAPQYVAIENGYFEEEGLDVELILTPGADNVMAAVLSGDVEVGFSGSEATFYVSGELLSGSIKFEDLMYNIAVSSEIKDKKTVYIVFITDWKKDRERLKSWLNPLKYFSFGKKGDINVTPAMSPANLNSTYNLSGTAGTIRG